MNYNFIRPSLHKLRLIQFGARSFSSKVPLQAIKPIENTNNKDVKIDKTTINLLERLSLVKCDTVEGVKVLEDSIAFANKILDINTDNIEPLYSVLENE
jgi:aspartyl-tRNA(Asn)/glutamyl-tRNA(Gln) amidotransferase subunit C